MISIKLIDDWSLTSDSHNIILNKNNRAFGYFQTVEGAILGMIGRCIRDSDAKTIRELINFQKSLETAINNSQPHFQIKMRQSL